MCAGRAGCPLMRSWPFGMHSSGREVDSAEIARIERSIRSHCEAGDRTRAATVLLEGYGRELLGFLIVQLRDQDAAAEVFSDFTEDLWRGIDGFRWRSSARVWSYTLVRHAASRYLRGVRRHRGRHVPLSEAGPLSEIEQKVRTATLSAYGTEARSRMAKLREALSAEDQSIIVLRVNRKLTWKEIAQVMLDEGAIAVDAVLDKEAVRLRKRYQVARERLRQMAAEPERG
jgi:RNA polymerase sigma-70 factor (ECF subfamily)